jgi:hypothetical protein
MTHYPRSSGQFGENRPQGEEQRETDRLIQIVIKEKSLAIETALQRASSDFPNRDRLLALVKDLRALL